MLGCSTHVAGDSIFQDPPSTLNWGYMAPDSGYLGPDKGRRRVYLTAVPRPLEFDKTVFGKGSCGQAMLLCLFPTLLHAENRVYVVGRRMLGTHVTWPPDCLQKAVAIQA